MKEYDEIMLFLKENYHITLLKIEEIIRQKDLEIKENMNIKKEEYYQYLYDEKELKFFYDYILPPLKENEVYFLSLAARNKKLNEEERSIYKIGRSEMFQEEIVSSNEYNKYLQAIKRYEVRKDSILTKSGVSYPNKTLVCYVNLAPSNIYYSLIDLNKDITNLLVNLTNNSLINSKDGISDSYRSMKKIFHNNFHKVLCNNTSSKIWIDIDIDINPILQEYENMKKYFYELGFKKNDIVYIRTAGGFHCLIRKSVLKELKLGSKFLDIFKTLENDIFKHELVKEVTINKNNMVPCPGTLQYGECVHILNKEDFSESDKLR